MMYRLRLPGALYRLAQTRAEEEGTTVDTVLLAALTAYADHAPSPGAQLAAAGGRARAAQLSADELSAIGRRGAQARWANR